MFVIIGAGKEAEEHGQGHKNQQSSPNGNVVQSKAKESTGAWSIVLWRE